MSTVALAGDCTTTLALALASQWPTHQDVIVVEADPSGGSIAAWLDVPLAPSLSTLVAAAHAGELGDAARPGDGDPTGGSADGRERLTALVRRSSTGVGYVPAPFRSREAARAVHEARRGLFELLPTVADVVIADCGRVMPGELPAATADGSDVTVLCHRQDPASAGAATARIERLREHVEMLMSTGRTRPVVAVVGDRPFPLEEIRDSVAPDLPWVGIAVDPLAASTLAGRVGVSARRLSRLPLSRTARELADVIAAAVAADVGEPGPRHPEPHIGGTRGGVR